jgi:transposase
MPKILQIEDPLQVKEDARKYFKRNEDARFVRRLDIVLLICEGHSLPYVSDLFGVNPTTVQRWIHRLNESGLSGLKDQTGRGRPPRLSETDLSRLCRDVKQSPQVFGYDATRWDGKLLSHHLRTQYGIDLKVRQCQNLFKKMGFSLQRPRKMPMGGDPEEREAFKKTP